MFLSVDSTNQKFLVREISDNGKAKNRKVDFNASLYLKSNKNEDEPDGIAFKSNIQLKKFNFDSSSEYWEFKKKFAESGVYGEIQPVFQYLSNYRVDEDKVKFINPWSIDIEVYARGEFPSPEKAHKFPIVAITLGDMLKNKYYSFVYDINGKLTIDSKSNWEILSFATEEAMLESFINFWKMNLKNIHILTGWNSETYDIPYIVNRLLHVFQSDEHVNNLSPFKSIKEKTDKFKNTSIQLIGLPHLDYLKLFKKFNFKPRSSYTLENISQDELNHGKLDHSEYGSYADFYDKNIDKYIEYNFLDVKLIKELDDKFKYISLAITIATLCKINFENIYSPIKCWEGLMYSKLKDNGLVLPIRHHKRKESYMGAFVKEPKSGLIRDIISYDLTSLYPSVIRALNCSPETLVEYETDDEATIQRFLDGYIPIESHDKNRIVCAAGNIYTKDKDGIVPLLMKETFISRKSAQKKARELNKLLDEKKKELKKLKE